jgi:teichuronic acid biosynthesis glycosyltransferase TuaC
MLRPGGGVLVEPKPGVQTPGPRVLMGGTETRPIHLLTFSTLFPNAAQLNHGVFVENRLRHLVGSGSAESIVLAPVPWFPGRTPKRGQVPSCEVRHGITVHHPRFLAPAGLGMFTNPITLYRCALTSVRALMAAGHRFDLIDGHYLYPDGVVAVWLGKALGLPVVLTARGSDTSQLPHFRLPGFLIRRAIARADALIAVSAGLKQGLIELGAPESKISVLRNGVDLSLFRPASDRRALRAALGLDVPTLLSVGHLIERKRTHLIIEALALLPRHCLLIVGQGPEESALRALADRLGVMGRIRFIGSVPHAKLAHYYAAADVMVLASSREGWANVLLESMACGTPVVATPVWGSSEAVSAPEAGIVVKEATAEELAEAISILDAAPPDRTDTAAYAARFSWDETTAGQVALIRRVLQWE